MAAVVYGLECASGRRVSWPGRVDGWKCGGGVRVVTEALVAVVIVVLLFLAIVIRGARGDWEW